MGSIPEENTNTNTRGHTVKQLILLSRTTGVPPVVQKHTHTTQNNMYRQYTDETTNYFLRRFDGKAIR